MSGPAGDDHSDRLKRLDERLARAKAPYEERPHQENHYSQANEAWRMVTELVAGLAIGFGIGYGLDWLLGTKPFLMIVFVLVGFVAGMKTVLRTAEDMQKKRAAAAATQEDGTSG